jgi:hypothetical protein
MTEKPNLREYLLTGPKVDEFEISRELDTGRTIRLTEEDDPSDPVDSPIINPTS